MLVKQLLGEATAAEQLAVEKWLKEEETNRQYYHHLKQIWEHSKELAVVSAADENKAWQKFRERVATTPVPARPANKQFSVLKIAASIILAVGLALAAYFINSKNNAITELTATTGQNILTDTLSDGSVVTLNKKSSVSYPSRFKGNTRSVKLQGEAFFHVTPDKKKPFIISVNDVEVTVVGTSFNIKSDAAKTEVVVETGVVRVSRNRQTVELKAGEKLLLSGKNPSALKETAGDKLYNYYRTKEFVCDNTPLWKLVDVLNEAYDTHIIIGRKELKDLRLTTTFDNESLDKIMEIIHLTFSITVVKQDGQIILQ